KQLAAEWNRPIEDIDGIDANTVLAYLAIPALAESVLKEQPQLCEYANSLAQIFNYSNGAEPLVEGAASIASMLIAPLRVWLVINAGAQSVSAMHGQSEYQIMQDKMMATSYINIRDLEEQQRQVQRDWLDV